MYPSQPPLFVSIQSQKGGVGKTSVAFHVANLLLDSYEALFLDLDLTGTDAATAATVLSGETFWKDTLHTIPAPQDKAKQDQKANLVSIFGQYMSGEPTPSTKWVDASNARTVGRNCLRLQQGRVNVLSSYLPRPDEKSAGIDGDNGHMYGPSVLFDSLHAEWLLELIKEIVEASCQELSGKPLAVVIDNAPGYSGLEPALEEWLTDLGPIQAKFLFVATPDTQDLEATAKAMQRVRKKQADKAKATSFFFDPKEKTLSKPQKAFFLKLVEAVSDKFIDCKLPKPDKSEHQECTDCGFCYYIAKKGVSDEDAVDSFVRAIVNKVPNEFIIGSLQKIKDDLEKCPINSQTKDLVLDGENAIPLFHNLMFQFCSNDIARIGDKAEPNAVESKKELIKKLELAKKTFRSKGQEVLDVSTFGVAAKPL
jgi:MinD-like ATPase involved in chromosome partitioning or flagellar assembly